jgi:hypothetical protein
MKKCIHYHICINAYELLCNDSKCSLVKNLKQKEDMIRVEKVRQAIDEYKANLRIKSFSELDVRG